MRERDRQRQDKGERKIEKTEKERVYRQRKRWDSERKRQRVRNIQRARDPERTKQ